VFYLTALFARICSLMIPTYRLKDDFEFLIPYLLSSSRSNSYSLRPCPQASLNTRIQAFYKCSSCSKLPPFRTPEHTLPYIWAKTKLLKKTLSTGFLEKMIFIPLSGSAHLAVSWLRQAFQGNMSRAKR
jgi:hypothetical protein